jgi:hypothetical protein
MTGRGVQFGEAMDDPTGPTTRTNSDYEQRFGGPPYERSCGCWMPE